MQHKSEEYGKDKGNGTMEWLELSINKIILHVSHAFVELKPRGGNDEEGSVH